METPNLGLGVSASGAKPAIGNSTVTGQRLKKLILDGSALHPDLSSGFQARRRRPH
jgi:hypothetical protein